MQPNDPRLLQKLGELLQKSGDDLGAAETFLRVAQQYARDGFFVKAIALGKQCFTLNPNLTEAIELVADWHMHLDLRSEAAAYYQQVLKHHRVACSVAGVERVIARLTELGAPFDPGGPRN